MDILWQDLRFGVRTLRRNPGITAIAIIALALGIGGNSAIFSVVNAVLLRPLPFFEPERIMQIWTTAPNRGLAQTTLSFQRFTAISEQSQTLESCGAYINDTVNLTGMTEPLQLKAARISVRWMDVLRIKPALGRNFLPEEDKRGGAPVAMISYGLWQRQFGSEAGIVGKAISLDGASVTVVGVMPPGFDLIGTPADVWLPRVFEPSYLSQPQVESGAGFLKVIARLKPGVSQRQAQMELEAIAVRNDQPGHPDAHSSLRAIPLPEQMTGAIRPTLLILLGAVAFVLLIACANVANLLLAKAIGRQKEMTVRAALGASRGRLMRQLLTETIFLAIIASALGGLLAHWSISLLTSASTGNLPRVTEINIDGRVLGFTLVIGVLTGLIFGLAPALQASKTDLNVTLKDHSRGSTGGLRRHRLRHALVVAEMMMSVVLLIGAGLLIKSFIRLQTLHPGFNAHQVLVANLSLPPSKYSTPLEQKMFYHDLLPELSTLPGVASVGGVELLPLAGNDQKTPIAVGDRPLPPISERPLVSVNSVSPNYFQTLGIPLLQGRFLDEHDDTVSPFNILINQSFKRRFFPDEDPIGQHLITATGRQIQIVGVVGDVRFTGLTDTPTESFYIPFHQRPFVFMAVVLRTIGPPLKLAPAVQSKVQRLDKDQPVSSFQTMEEVVSSSIADRRFTLLLIGVFAGLALLLSSLGIYSVMAYTVSQRTAEIGLRMALGAQRSDVLKLIIGQGLTMVVIGLVLGLGVAWGLTRVLSSLLFNVSTTDPMIFVFVPLLLSVTALAACLAPASRAAKIDPIVALRSE